MKKENDINLAENPSLVYVGNDTYWFESFKKFAKTKFPELEIEDISIKDPKKVQGNIYQFLYKQPRIICVDISQHSEETLHFIRLLKSTNMYFKSIVIALMSSTLKQEFVYRAIMSRADLCQYKADDFLAISNSISALAFSEQLEEHGLAFANLEDEIALNYPCKIGLVEKDFITIETNLNLKVDEEYFLNTFLQDEDISPYTGVHCVEVTQRNLYYPYKNKVKLKLNYIAPVEVSEDRKDDKEYLAELESMRQKKIKEKREKLEDWIDRKSNKSRPKKKKILIVDRNLRLYQDEILSSKYSFAVRGHPFLMDPKVEIEKHYADLIFFQKDTFSKEELEELNELDDIYKERINTIEKLQQIISTIMKIDDYNPIIICFGIGENQLKNIKSSTGYEWMLSYNEPLNNELVIKMSDLYISKNENEQKENIGLFYPDKDDQISYGEIQIPTTLLGWSECDIYFEAPLEFPTLTTLRFNHKTTFFVTVAPMPKHSPYQKALYAVIHGVDESNVMEIRRYVNEVFFREKQKAKEEELKQFEQAKVDYVKAKEKEEEERKAAEAEGDPLDQKKEKQQDQDSEQKEEAPDLEQKEEAPDSEQKEDTPDSEQKEEIPDSDQKEENVGQ